MKDKITCLDTFLVKTCTVIFGVLLGMVIPKERRKITFSVGMGVFLLSFAGIVYRVMKIQETEDLQITEQK